MHYHARGIYYPLHVRDGLPRMDMRIPMDAEMDKCPHVFIMADSTWDPSVLDNEFEEEFYDAVTELPEVQARRNGTDPRVDDYGFLRSRQDDEILFKAQDEFIAANANTTTQSKQETPRCVIALVNKEVTTRHVVP